MRECRRILKCAHVNATTMRLSLLDTIRPARDKPSLAIASLNCSGISAVEITSIVASSSDSARTVQSKVERPELKVICPALNTRRRAGEIDGAGATQAIAWLRPAFLAEYIARSALRRASSKCCPASSEAAPKLQVTGTGPHGVSITCSAIAAHAISKAAMTLAQS